MVLLAHQDATFSSRLSNNNYQTGSEYPRKESTIVTTSRQAAKTEPRIESGKRLSSAILTPVTGTSFDDGQFIVSGPLLPIRQSRRGINPNRNFRIVGSQAFMAAEMQHNPDAMNTMMAPPTPVSASVSSASYSSHVNDQMPELDSAESSANSSKSTISSEGVIASRARGMGKYDKHHIPSIQELPMDPVTLPYQHSGSAGISHHVPSSSSRAGHSYSSLNGVGEHEVRSSAVPVSALLPGARAAMRKSVSPTDSLVASGGMAVQQQYLVQRMPVRPQAETGERQSNESPSLSSSQIRLASPQIRVSNQAPRSLSPETQEALSGPSVRSSIQATNRYLPAYYADTEMDAVHADTRSGTNGNGWSGSHDKEQTKVGREARDSWNLPSDDNSTRQTDRQRKRQGLQAPTTTEHFHVRPLNLAAANDHSLHGQPSLSTILTDSPVDAQYHTSSPLSASISMKSYHPMLTDYLYAASSADEMPAHSEKLHSQPSEAVLAEKSPSPRMRDPVHQRITHDHRATSFDLGHIGRASEHVFAKQNKHQLHFASGPNSQHQSPVIRTASRISAGSGRASRLARAGTRSSERLASSSPRVQLDPGQHVEEGYEGDSEGMLNAGSWPPMQRRNTVACDKIDDTPSLSQWPTRVKPRNTGDFASMSLSKDDRRGLRGSRRRSTTNALTPIGTQIAPGHANYVLMYNMLTGIRVSVSRCEAKDSRPVRFDDYTAMHKYSFDVVGDEMTSSSRYDFKFKDYAPWVFRCIREAFHLSTEDYLVSLTDKYILSEVGSSGKSGSFFYYSQDYRFIIKTVHHTEHKFMRDILPQYYEFVRDHPNTLLSRIYGLHRIKLPRGRKVHFIVMSNILPPNKDIHAQFDLKGSMLGRELSPELALKPRACMKDRNWLNFRQRLHLGPEKRRAFVKQLIEDVTLLIRLNIMDYSLLIGIHDLTRGNASKLRDTTLAMFDPQTTDVHQINRLTRAHTIRKKVVHTDPVTLDSLPQGSIPPLPESMFQELRHSIFYREDGGILSTDRNDSPMQLIYYLGVIDILTPYNFVKRTEHVVKSLVHDGSQISAINPRKYGLRFLRFMVRSLDGYEDVLPLLDEFEQTTYEAICREHRLF